MTGLHTVSDLYCADCDTEVGWYYNFAYEPSQKYKENKFILVENKIEREERGQGEGEAQSAGIGMEDEGEEDDEEDEEEEGGDEQSTEAMSSASVVMPTSLEWRGLTALHEGEAGPVVAGGGRRGSASVEMRLRMTASRPPPRVAHTHGHL